MKGKTWAAVPAAAALAAAVGAGIWLLVRSGLFAGFRLAAVAAAVCVLVGAFGFLLSVEIGGKGRGRDMLWLAAGCAAAICARLVHVDFASGDYITFLSQWVEYFRANGGFKAIAGSVGDYNVTYLYFLALFSYSPLPDLFLIKMLSTAFDFVAAFYAMKIAGTQKQGTAVRAAAFFAVLFMPTVLINSSIWAQCDSIYTAFALGALYFALRDNGPASMAMLGVSLAFKLQAVFIFPLWAAAFFGRRFRLKWLPVLPAAFFLTALPAVLLGKPIADIINVYIAQTGEYTSSLTWNAPSVFVFFSGAGKTGAYIGIAAAAAFCLLAALLARRVSGSVSDRTMCLCALSICMAVPYLLPYMHDRYFYLPGVLAFGAAAAMPWLYPAAVLAEFSSLLCYKAYFDSRLVNNRTAAICMGAALVYVAAMAAASGAAEKLGKNKGR